MAGPAQILKMKQLTIRGKYVCTLCIDELVQ